MNKKGFTLIELLAVILVLGIIALIAIPVVNKVIDQAKKGAFERTTESIIKAVEEECEKDMLLGNNTEKIYKFTDGVASPPINVKGKLPKSGVIIVNKTCETMVNVTDGKYSAAKAFASDDLLIIESGGKTCYATNGDGTQIGDEITCGTESFYVYDTTGDNIKMLSKYNLKVSGVYNYLGEEYYTFEHYRPYKESEVTYMQDPNMRGWVEDQDIWGGVTAFSSADKHGEEYSSYEGSIVEGYVDNYKEILINMGLTVQDARLISKEELEALGCNNEDWGCSPEYGGTAPEWVYLTTYWTGSAFDYDSLWLVTSGGSFDDFSYSGGDNIGVRPVIIISKSEL